MVAKQSEAAYMAASMAFAWWKWVKTVGGFHPILLPHYLSDYEYTIRTGRMGYRLETSVVRLVDLNHETTGYHQISEPNFRTVFRNFFSIKSAAHPVYLSTFIALTCPPRLVQRHLFVTWNNARKAIVRGLINSIKHARADRTVRL